MTLGIYNYQAAIANRYFQQAQQSYTSSLNQLSSGLRITSSADDAAGMAFSQSLSAEIASLERGMFNLADGISLAQTAESSRLSIYDALIQMKTLAEQAATGTYSAAQRIQMEESYQNYAAQIQQIAEGSEYNGIDLLDGDAAGGIRIHFGSGNSSAEDYYSFSIQDMRAYEALLVGTTGQEEVLYSRSGWESSSSDLGVVAGATEYVTLYYGGTDIEDIQGFYTVGSSDTPSALAEDISVGTAARISVDFSSAPDDGTLITIGGDEVYEFNRLGGTSGGTIEVDIKPPNNSVQDAAAEFARMVNDNSSYAWAIVDSSDDTVVHLFARTLGAGGNEITLGETDDTGGAIALGGSSFSGGGVQNILATAERNDDFTGDSEFHLVLRGTDKQDGYSISFGSANSLLDMDTPVTDFEELNASGDAVHYQSASGSNTYPAASILTAEKAADAISHLEYAAELVSGYGASLGSAINRMDSSTAHLQNISENLTSALNRVMDVDVADAMLALSKAQMQMQLSAYMLNVSLQQQRSLFSYFV